MINGLIWCGLTMVLLAMLIADVAKKTPNRETGELDGQLNPETKEWIWGLFIIGSIMMGIGCII